MKVTINEREITLKKTYRSYIIYEAITNKSFAPSTLTDILIYFYAVVTASAKDLEITLDEFLEWLDEHENAVNEFYAWLDSITKIEEITAPKADEKTKTAAKKEGGKPKK